MIKEIAKKHFKTQIKHEKTHKKINTLMLKT